MSDRRGAGYPVATQTDRLPPRLTCLAAASSFPAQKKEWLGAVDDVQTVSREALVHFQSFGAT